jgi:hypothetical protein
MSSIPLAFKAAVMLLLSKMTSVAWTKAAFDDAEVKVGRRVGMIGDQIKYFRMETVLSSVDC